jgi:cardiolipin synthase
MSAQPYPWRENNRFRLLNDGPEFFPQMLACIDAACQQVAVELYLVTSSACTDVLLAALCAAARRGVTVRCLFDAFGCQRLKLDDRRLLLESGVQLLWHNPLRWQHGLRNLYRDHRKLLLVDRQLAFVGGTGSSDDFWLPGAAVSAWHELMVQIRGPLVDDWQTLFDQQWQASLSVGPWRPHWRVRRKPLPQRPGSGQGWGRVAYADARQHRDILQSLIRALQTSESRVWLATEGPQGFAQSGGTRGGCAPAAQWQAHR